ncbi:MAG: 50S ribosomal protein L6 [Candidatus Omnitrophica bacterium]|nr:50S ribosomal protein L6 [Candidatus Omnitrophota bacterium]
MSRIGSSPIAIKTAVKVAQEGATIRVEGPKGKLSLMLPSELSVSVGDGKLAVARSRDLKPVKALHGLYRALLANMVRGVSEGFSKELEVVGVGYRAQTQGKQLELQVGFSHPVKLPIPEGLTIETPKPTIIIVKGIDKQLVGQMAATIRRVAPPEPYKGKGIKYAGEVIRRKAGKAATGAKGASA